MKIISVLMLCALMACTKSQTHLPVTTISDVETPVSNPLEQTDGDSIRVETSVVEYAEGANSRWKVEVYLSRATDEPVYVTIEWNGPLGPVSFVAALEPGQRERRIITDFATPIDSSPEEVRITNVSCDTPELVFMY
jgi:hypothetical protein